MPVQNKKFNVQENYISSANVVKLAGKVINIFAVGELHVQCYHLILNNPSLQITGRVFKFAWCEISDILEIEVFV